MSDEMLQEGAQIIEELSSIPDDKASFDNVFSAIRKFQNVTSTAEIFNFLLYVHPDVSVLTAADQYLTLFENEMINWDTEIHNKVFKVIDNINNGKFKKPRNSEDLMYLQKYENERKRMGYNLTDDLNQEYGQLQMKINNNMNKFYSCMGGNPSDLVFTEKELEGVPQNIMDTFEKTTKENGKEAYIVSLSNQASSIIITHAIHGNTRKEYLKARNSRCNLNVDVLKETVNIR
ncbi:hypothetical protein PIROE2DRAFT_63941 [Piromyces sp. E2]|nr:hypothetical protein PIROE2DRAFT_63941 [Piromyces sp. E2]|eukprot:OUM59167.1 hypothetical protein PIROE2DRAFT_63941 [Piromyces sp. E2]